MPLRGDLYDYESYGPPPWPDYSVEMQRACAEQTRLRHVFGCWACDVAYTSGEGAFCGEYLRMGWIAQRREMER
jgi:hypothetical protein